MAGVIGFFKLPSCLGACLCWTDFLAKALKKEFIFFPFHVDSSWKCGDGAQPEVNWVFMAEGKESFNVPPLSCLTSLPSVMVKSWAERGYDESSSGCRARTLWSFVCQIFVCGFLCADFWCGFFGADFSVRIFWCGFLVRIFRCGSFNAHFSVRMLHMQIFGRIFKRIITCARRPQGIATCKIQQKIHQKILPKMFLSKNPPKDTPQIPLRIFAVGPH